MQALDIRDLGTDVDYAATVALQESLLAERVAGKIPDTLLLLEHKPVFTLGRSARAANVLWSEAELARRGIACVATTRGGDVTYHGTGQLVGYPIVHLGAARMTLTEYVHGVEETLLRALATFGITGERNARNHGVWIGGDKIAAIGLRVSRQVSMHGFSLNVTTRLEDCRGIVACGLRDAGVTSMAQVLGQAPAMADVKSAVLLSFCEVFGCHMGLLEK
jgi:lipoyl(octanoyl) transferase